MIRGGIEFRRPDVRAIRRRRRAIGARRRVAGIAAGQTAAFVGATGSGKSTLISLLPRLHDPPPGTVFIDGVDVREIPLAALRGAIGFVRRSPSSSPTRSPRTSRSASTTGGRSGDRRSARGARREALRRSRASTRTSSRFPTGYDTLVGERGITLSGGQKQRTAHRARADDRPAHPVLDDALSAVDTYTEEEILTRLRGVMRAAHVAHRVAPGLDRARRRPDSRPRRRPHRRARHATTSWCARRLVRGAVSQAAAGGGAGGKLRSGAQGAGAWSRCRQGRWMLRESAER